MSDKEQDIPVKVVDRRWWANTDASADRSEGATTSLKPTYVEELEQKVAEKDKQIQEYSDEIPPGVGRVRGDAPSTAAGDLEGHRTDAT